MKRPPRLAEEDWQNTDEYVDAAANYQPVRLDAKEKFVVKDLRKLLVSAKDEGEERPLKVVVYSGMKTTLNKVASALRIRQVRFEYAARHTAVSAPCSGQEALQAICPDSLALCGQHDCAAVFAALLVKFWTSSLT